MTILEFGAKWFAVIAHSLAQNRLHNGSPYSIHCWQVVQELRTMSGADKYMLAAAWLHDVVEDAGIKQSTIYFWFGKIVGDYVYYLTDQCTLADGNRKTRKEIERKRLHSAPYKVQVIKICDCYCNGVGIKWEDPDFWETYRAEIIELINGFEYNPEYDIGDLYTRIRLAHVLEMRICYVP